MKQLTLWHNLIGGFDEDVVNAAVLELAASDVRFPDSGDLYQLCRRIAIRYGRLKVPYAPLGTGEKEIRTTDEEIQKMAERFGLKVPGRTASRPV